ncbi:hypothetical protein Agub_g3634, partial [Astrephomene gubernaculifera]
LLRPLDETTAAAAAVAAGMTSGVEEAAAAVAAAVGSVPTAAAAAAGSAPASGRLPVLQQSQSQQPGGAGSSTGEAVAAAAGVVVPRLVAGLGRAAFRQVVLTEGATPSDLKSLALHLHEELALARAMAAAAEEEKAAAVRRDLLLKLYGRVLEAPGMSLRDTFTVILDTLYRVIECDVIKLYLVDHSRGQLWPASRHGAADANRTLPLYGTLAGSAVRRAAVVRVDDVAREPLFNQELEELPAGYSSKSMMVIPVFAPSHVHPAHAHHLRAYGSASQVPPTPTATATATAIAAATIAAPPITGPVAALAGAPAAAGPNAAANPADPNSITATAAADSDGFCYYSAPLAHNHPQLPLQPHTTQHPHAHPPPPPYHHQHPPTPAPQHPHPPQQPHHPPHKQHPHPHPHSHPQPHPQHAPPPPSHPPSHHHHLQPQPHHPHHPHHAQHPHPQPPQQGDVIAVIVAVNRWTPWAEAGAEEGERRIEPFSAADEASLRDAAASVGLLLTRRRGEVLLAAAQAPGSVAGSSFSVAAVLPASVARQRLRMVARRSSGVLLDTRANLWALKQEELMGQARDVFSALHRHAQLATSAPAGACEQQQQQQLFGGGGLGGGSPSPSLASSLGGSGGGGGGGGALAALAGGVDNEALLSYLVRIAGEQGCGQFFNLAHSVGVLQGIYLTLRSNVELASALGQQHLLALVIAASLVNIQREGEYLPGMAAGGAATGAATGAGAAGAGYMGPGGGAAWVGGASRASRNRASPASSVLGAAAAAATAAAVPSPRAPPSLTSRWSPFAAGSSMPEITEQQEQSPQQKQPQPQQEEGREGKRQSDADGEDMRPPLEDDDTRPLAPLPRNATASSRHSPAFGSGILSSQPSSTATQPSQLATGGSMGVGMGAIAAGPVFGRARAVSARRTRLAGIVDELLSGESNILASLSAAEAAAVKANVVALLALRNQPTVVLAMAGLQPPTTTANKAPSEGRVEETPFAAASGVAAAAAALKAEPSGATGGAVTTDSGDNLVVVEEVTVDAPVSSSGAFAENTEGERSSSNPDQGKGASPLSLTALIQAVDSDPVRLAETRVAVSALLLLTWSELLHLKDTSTALSLLRCRATDVRNWASRQASATGNVSSRRKSLVLLGGGEDTLDDVQNLLLLEAPRLQVEVIPLWQRTVELLPGLQPQLDTLQANRAAYVAMLQAASATQLLDGVTPAGAAGRPLAALGGFAAAAAASGGAGTAPSPLGSLPPGRASLLRNALGTPPSREPRRFISVKQRAVTSGRSVLGVMPSGDSLEEAVTSDRGGRRAFMRASSSRSYTGQGTDEGDEGYGTTAMAATPPPAAATAAVAGGSNVIGRLSTGGGGSGGSVSVQLTRRGGMSMLRSVSRAALTPGGSRLGPQPQPLQIQHSGPAGIAVATASASLDLGSHVWPEGGEPSPRGSALSKNFQAPTVGPPLAATSNSAFRLRSQSQDIKDAMSELTPRRGSITNRFNRFFTSFRHTVHNTSRSAHPVVGDAASAVTSPIAAVSGSATSPVSTITGTAASASGGVGSTAVPAGSVIVEVPYSGVQESPLISQSSQGLIMHSSGPVGGALTTYPSGPHPHMVGMSSQLTSWNRSQAQTPVAMSPTTSFIMSAPALPPPPPMSSPASPLRAAAATLTAADPRASAAATSAAAAAASADTEQDNSAAAAAAAANSTNSTADGVSRSISGKRRLRTRILNKLSSVRLPFGGGGGGKSGRSSQPQPPRASPVPFGGSGIDAAAATTNPRPNSGPALTELSFAGVCGKEPPSLPSHPLPSGLSVTAAAAATSRFAGPASPPSASYQPLSPKRRSAAPSGALALAQQHALYAARAAAAAESFAACQSTSAAVAASAGVAYYGTGEREGNPEIEAFGSIVPLSGILSGGVLPTVAELTTSGRNSSTSTSPRTNDGHATPFPGGRMSTPGSIGGGAASIPSHPSRFAPLSLHNSATQATMAHAAGTAAGAASHPSGSIGDLSVAPSGGSSTTTRARLSSADRAVGGASRRRHDLAADLAADLAPSKGAAPSKGVLLGLRLASTALRSLGRGTSVDAATAAAVAAATAHGGGTPEAAPYLDAAPPTPPLPPAAAARPAAGSTCRPTTSGSVSAASPSGSRGLGTVSVGSVSKTTSRNPSRMMTPSASLRRGGVGMGGVAALQAALEMAEAALEGAGAAGGGGGGGGVHGGHGSGAGGSGGYPADRFAYDRALSGSSPDSSRRGGRTASNSGTTAATVAAAAMRASGDSLPLPSPKQKFEAYNNPAFGLTSEDSVPKTSVPLLMQPPSRFSLRRSATARQAAEAVVMQPSFPELPEG